VNVTHIDIGRDFATNLGPRYKKDGKHSGQEFRERLLEPAFVRSDVVVISLDSIGGYSASFLEEAFGGLVRQHGYAEVSRKLKLDAVARAYLKPVIEQWMRDADPSAGTGATK